MITDFVEVGDVVGAEDKPVPEGFMQDHRGALIPVDIVKEVDVLRDQLVKEIVDKADALSKVLAEFKLKAMDDVAAFVSLSAGKYGVKLGGHKGNVSLVSYDGKYKVVRSINEYIKFDERLEAARALLDECLKQWTSEASDNLRKLVNFAFTVDKTGAVSTARIMGLLRVDIRDENWKKAMEAIKESFQVTGSKSYIRIYRRVGGTDKYEQINLDLASL